MHKNRYSNSARSNWRSSSRWARCEMNSWLHSRLRTRNINSNLRKPSKACSSWSRKKRHDRRKRLSDNQPDRRWSREFNMLSKAMSTSSATNYHLISLPPQAKTITTQWIQAASPVLQQQSPWSCKPKIWWSSQWAKNVLRNLWYLVITTTTKCISGLHQNRAKSERLPRCSTCQSRTIMMGKTLTIQSRPPDSISRVSLWFTQIILFKWLNNNSRCNLVNIQSQYSNYQSTLRSSHQNLKLDS